MFFVDHEPNATITDIFDVTSILHIKMKIEELYKQQQIPQRRMCQTYGHTKSYCSHSPRCVKCSEKNLTESYTKSVDSPAICALCYGCLIYKGSCLQRTSTASQTTFQFKKYRLTTPTVNTNNNLNFSILSQAANQLAHHTDTRKRSYANVAGNDITQNNMIVPLITTWKMQFLKFEMN